MKNRISHLLIITTGPGLCAVENGYDRLLFRKKKQFYISLSYEGLEIKNKKQKRNHALSPHTPHTPHCGVFFEKQLRSRFERFLVGENCRELMI